LQGADKPKTEYESLLCGIWAEVFELPEIGRNDNFFDLGGDSLIAAVMSARIHAALGIEVAPCRYFEHPELAGLAQVLSDLSQFKAPATPARELPVVRTGPIPLSYSQEAWWYRSQAPNLGGGHTTARCSRIAGPLDRGVLTECIKIIVRRHEMLRTTISLEEGQPAQVIHDPEDVQVAFYDVSADPNPEIKAKDIWKAEQAYIFDLTQPSLVRFSLIRLNDGEHWFLRSAHAMMGDGLSWTIFVRELAELYEARKQGRDSPLLQTLPAQYGDYAIAERKAVHPDLPRYRELLLWWAGFLLETAQPEHPAYRRALLRCMNAASSKPAFLRTILGALLRTGFRVPAPPRAELPFKRAKRKDIVDPSEGIIHWGLKPAVSLRLHELARQQGATRYAVRAAAFVAMLAAETRKTNVVLFGALSNRNRAASRDVFGYCNMPAMFVFDCQQQWTFRELLSHIRVRISAMQAHADFPYDRLHQEMRIWKVKMPTARVMLSTAWSHPCIRSDGIEITCLPDRFNNPTPALFDLKFDPINEETNCSVFFDARVYDPMKVRAFVDGFVRLLEFVSSRPDATIRTAIAAIQGAEGQPTASK
jgi:hypothetical protein